MTRQATPKGHPNDDDSTDKGRNTKRTACKMHIQQLIIIQRKQQKNPRHKQETPHKASACNQQHYNRKEIKPKNLYANDSQRTCEDKKI